MIENTKEALEKLLEKLFEQEILALNCNHKPLIYRLEEGKFKVGYNKRTKLFYYHIDGNGVEEWGTAQRILECMQGFVWNQSEFIIKAILKSRL